MRSSSTTQRALLGSALLLTLSCGGDGGSGTEPTLNPAPTISAIVRDSATAGVTPFTVVLSGTGFMPGVVATFDGNVRATFRQSNTALNFLLQVPDLTTPGDHEIRVKNPEPGGGPSVAVLFHVLPQPPVPVLDSLSPDTVFANALGSLTLKAFGHGFVPGAVIRMNGIQTLTTTRVSDTLLQTTIVGGILDVAGFYTMQVFKQGPGGGTSAGRDFVVRPVPAPGITSLAPASMRTGGAAQTLHIYGQGFTPSTVIDFNTTNQPSTPPITFVADTELTLQVPLTELTTKKLALVSLQGASTYKVLQLLPPHVVVSSISPDSAGLGDSVVFNARGTGFVPGGDDNSNTLVRWRGVLLGTTFHSDTLVTVRVPAEHAQAGGVVPIAFVNQGDTDTSYAGFTITRPVPVITELTPATDTTGAGPRTLFGRATGIDSTVQVYLNGVLHPSAGAAPNWGDTSGYFSAQLAAGEAATPGPLVVTMVNLGPGGGTSAPDTLWLIPPNPIPALDSATPDPLAVGATGATITVHGKRLLPGAVAYVAQKDLEYGYSQQFPTTWLDSGSVQFVLPDSLAADAFTLSVRVGNPAPTADLSPRVFFHVRSSEITGTRHLALSVERLVGDTVHHRLYGSVSASDAGSPKLVVIDPVTATVTQELPVPGAVGALEISDDHQWLVAAFPAERLLRRYDLSTLTVDRTWGGPRSDLDSTLAPISISLLHGSGHILAVLSAPDYTVDGLNELVIFDDTLQRPRALHLLNWDGADLEFPSDSILVDVQAFAYGWRIFRVDSAGPDSVGAQQIGTSNPVGFHVRGDTVITVEGLIADLWTATALGHLPEGAITFGGGGLAFTVNVRGLYNVVHDLRATDLSTLLPVGTPIVTTGMQVSPSNAFVRWGPGGFAWGGLAGIDFADISRPGW